MKLLILTQYYPPEIGAPQNRLHELAVRLKSKGLTVEVLTAMPNYPKMEIFEGYKKAEIREEIIDGIRVVRSKIFVSKSKSIIPRLLNYFSFVWTSYWKGRKLDEYDYLLVESPPLFLGYSAMALSKKLNAKLIFNVSDLWPESAEKLNIVTNKSLLKFAYNLERKCYQSAAIITGQTQGIVNDIKARFPEKNVHWLPNGVDLSYYNPNNYLETNFRNKNGFNEQDVLLFYGGILGHAQGLEVLLYAAEKLKNYHEVKFILQGSGPEKSKLEKLCEKLGLENVFFLSPVSKIEMPYVLKGIDIAVVPLKNLPLFQGAIPSKIFEALAMEVPVLLGVDGEARRHFIENADAGWFFEPENFEQLVESVLNIIQNKGEVKAKGKNGRKYVSENFNRDVIAQNFMNVLQG